MFKHNLTNLVGERVLIRCLYRQTSYVESSIILEIVLKSFFLSASLAKHPNFLGIDSFLIWTHQQPNSEIGERRCLTDLSIRFDLNLVKF